jgi:hypothetical protein
MIMYDYLVIEFACKSNLSIVFTFFLNSHLCFVLFCLHHQPLLEAKCDHRHSHDIRDVTGLQETMMGFAHSEHIHNLDQVQMHNPILNN